MLRLSDILKKYKEKFKKVEPEELGQAEDEVETEEVKPAPPQVQEPKISISSAVCKGVGIISSDDLAELYEEALSLAKHIYTSELEQCFISWINTLVEKLVDVICKGNDKGLLRICLTDYAKKEDYLYGHVVNVCILVIKIGLGLSFERSRLIELGTAALVHDIGMVKYLNIINKNQKLTKDEYDKVKQHPNNGSESLSRIGKELSVAVIDAVRQEHERIDGSGYPLGLKGEEISEYAQIVGLADMYEAMMHSRPYRAKYKPLETINTILKAKQEFESKLIKILIERVGVFPVGIRVRLNTKEIGVVVKENPELALRPVVDMLFDAHKKKLKEPKQIDLSENPVIYIEDCVDETFPEIESEEEKE
jgi:HD-GYP domain-containing protein (c-di-GMP phosphodiesterase class II)